MDETHQDKANHNLATTQEVDWVPSKKSKLLIPQYKDQTKGSKGWTGFSGRTLWDWIQFFAVLAIPIIVAAGTLYFTQQITLQQSQASEKQHQTDLQIAADQQREDVLVNYQKDISDLMLNYHLASSREFDVVRVIARAKTLTALRKLDPDRKRLLIQFLDEANLIDIDTKAEVSDFSLGSVINLYMADLSYINLQGVYITTLNFSGADMYHANLYRAWIGCEFLGPNGYVCSNLSYTILQSADLSYANFSGDSLKNANLSYANLSNAALEGTNLNYANLEGANLNGADLTDANFSGASVTSQQLSQAKSLKGAIMPDGSKHP